MTTHTFQDATNPAYTLEIHGDLLTITCEGVRPLGYRMPDSNRPAIAAAIHPHTPEPMFKANATFDDIQKGDTVRAIIDKNGVIITREGTVHELDKYWWRNADRSAIAPSPEATSYPNPTIHILSRPTPQLPTQPGSAIWIMEGQYDLNVVTNKPAILDSERSWVSFNEDGNTVWLDPEHITTWEPLNHVTTHGRPVEYRTLTHP